jgi:hypothetical protein
MAGITIPDKSTGDNLTASEFNQLLDALKDGTLDITTDAINTNSKIFIDQDSNTLAFEIDSESTNIGTFLVNAENTTGDCLRANVSSLTTGRGFYIYSNSASFTGSDGLARIFVDNASASGNALVVRNDGTGDTLLLDVNGNARGIEIDHEATSKAALRIYNDVAHTGTTSESLVWVKQGNASSSGTMITLENDGTGTTAFLDVDGNAKGLFIDTESTSQNAIDIDAQNTSGDILSVRNFGNQASGTAILAYQDNASSTAYCYHAINDGTGNTLFLDHNNSGQVINISQDVNDASDCVGIRIKVDNTGAGSEYAFRFDGSEVVSAAVGGTQDKKIRISIGGTDYFIPCNTA